MLSVNFFHDDVIKWKHFPRNWPFVREIHRSPVNFPHKGQWRGALMFSLIYAWMNDWVNNREAGDLRRQHGHYDVIVMFQNLGYDTKLSNSIGWYNTQASPRLCCDPQFSWTCQHQRMFTTGNALWRRSCSRLAWKIAWILDCQYKQCVPDVINPACNYIFRHELINLKKSYGPVLWTSLTHKSHHTSRCSLPLWELILNKYFENETLFWLFNNLISMMGHIQIYIFQRVTE